MECCSSIDSTQAQALLDGSNSGSAQAQALQEAHLITGAVSHICRGPLCTLTAGHLTDESDHSRSATAAARGQVRAMLLVASTFSPHMQASPPITKSC